jgi:hypothetical protein
LILLFGALGVVSLLMEFDTLKAGLEHDTANYAMVLAGFVLPLLMGLMGVMKPPFMAWQAAVALAGFALVAVKLRIWDTLPHIGEVPMAGKLGMVAVVGGGVGSVRARVMPENRS